jgi:rare lipoprotein A
VGSQRWLFLIFFRLFDYLKLPTHWIGELMNQKILSGITTTAFVTVLGAIAFLNGSGAKAVASEVDSSTKGQISQSTEKKSENAIGIVYEQQWKDLPNSAALENNLGDRELNKEIAKGEIAWLKQKPSKTFPVQAGTKQVRGIASWYGPGFHGRQTANGERFNQNEMTAAHRSLPFGTKVRVTNSNNGRSVIVRINDRGPYVGNRLIDLSAAAAQAIGLQSSGVGPVNIEILGQ